MLLIGLALLACLLGSSHGCGSDPPPPNKPPIITCPSIGTLYKADKKLTTTTVTWTAATATDPEKKAVTVSLKSAKAPGSLFGRGTHTVAYEAMDNGGLKDFCMFTFTVQVIQCRMVNYIKNGRVQCEGSNYGHTCNFDCEEGYKLVGNRNIECLKTGQWNHGNPQCVAKECPVMDNPAHSTGFTCTNDRKAGSICWLLCDENKGYAPARGQFTKCSVDQTWTNLRMECIDVEDPQIHDCPTQTLVKTKDPTSAQTYVTWEKSITVTDNSGDAIEVKAEGAHATAAGGLFEEGVTLVKFTAEDKAKNSAPSCTFIVRIQTVSCDPPKMDDQYLSTPGCIDFREGKSCALDCYLALQLVGPKVITCKKGDSSSKQSKGYWSYGQNDTPPAEKPFCRVHNCTKLRSPDYGAIACDKWELGTQCMISCRKGYDIPDSSAIVSSLYQCLRTTGSWYPTHVPNCAWREHGEKVRMKGYYYFTGSCWSSKDIIKANFITAVEENKTCPADKYCKVENVEVRCGDEPDDGWRRKRSLRYKRRPRRRPRPSYFKFDVTAKITDKSIPIEQEFAEVKDAVTNYMYAASHVQFNVNATRTIKVYRFKKTAAVPLCRPGLKIGLFNKDSCVPCPGGSYHNVTRDECLACPLGQFQTKEGQSTCDHCPSGQTTITVANNETTACQDMCVPGTFSPSGVVPCGKCPVGTFATQVNTTRCTECPTGTTTEEDGANSASMCLPFDMLFQGPVSSPLEGKTPLQICDFTFAVWIKTVSEASDGIRFQISNPVDGISLQIEISTAIEVTLNRVHTVTAVNVLDTNWHHVAVIWSQNTMTLYTNSVVVKTQALPTANKCPSSTSSSMQVAIRNYAYVYLRDLNFLPEAKPSILAGMTKTCTSYLSGSLFALEQVDVQSNNRITEVIPSTCLRPDPCINNPCGDNVCIPGKNGVRCSCKRGYTGPKCKTPPDHCKDSICRNNATCYVSNGFACSCLPGFAGKLCERRIADGGWSKWYDWSECSTSCGQGVQTRMRFCTNPTPDSDGKPCSGSGRQTQPCNNADCPLCDESTLILGKGVTSSCVKSGDNITCTIACHVGKVLPERPFPYVCSSGFWTPTRQTVSCTDPVTPIAVGINYTVVFGNDISGQSQVETSLNRVGNDFTCSRDSNCDVSVGSSACSHLVPVCVKHGGAYFGSLIVKEGVPQATIDVTGIQQSGNPIIKPLFKTWTVFAHRSDELVTPLHRALEMEIVGNQLKVFPYGHTDQAVIVPGQFGQIMKAWKSLDNTNWEVRSINYTSFKAGTPTGARRPLYLTARQMMICPPGAVQGGVFCMQCPPGKYYVDEECKWCTHGLYQDQPGQESCKACPAFKTTENIGSSDIAQCIDTDVAELDILLGMTSPKIGVLHMTDLSYREIAMSSATGNVDYMAFNPRDMTVYFSTQSPNTIARVGYHGDNKLQLLTFPAGTVVTGLDVDIGSNLIFYTTNKGVLAAYHIVSGAQLTLLSDLPSSSGLILDQNFGIYWMETATIRHMHYGDKKPHTIFTDSHTVWGLYFDSRGGKLMWQSNNRLRCSNLDGSDVQTLSVKYTNRLGATDDYFFTVIKEGNNQRLMRENRDRTAFVKIRDVPAATSRIRVINVTNPETVDQPCLPSHKYCDQACLPMNTTAGECFCSSDYTLQANFKSCRRDFSVNFITDKADQWYKPKPSDYSVPPSKTLRFNVKACHSAKLALVETGSTLYLLRIDHRINNKTMIALYKQSRSTAKVVLREKVATLLDCDAFKTFWMTWQIDARITQVLKVGYGSVVGDHTQLAVADANPYKVNSVQFGVGVGATAHWQI